VACFWRQKIDRQITTFWTLSTTLLPSKNHVQTPSFSKTPLKNTSKKAKAPALAEA
jgi:hypothetical protein